MKKIASLTLLSALAITSITSAASAEQIPSREFSPTVTESSQSTVEQKEFRVERVYSSREEIPNWIEYEEDGYKGILGLYDWYEIELIGYIGVFTGILYR